MKSTTSINLGDFDFTVDRSRITSTDLHDGSMTIRIPGKQRKTANHELNFINYFKRNKLKFKTVAIGKSKTKKKLAPIVVFDESTLEHESTVVRKTGQKYGFVNSKGHALKLLNVFNVPEPKLPDEVIKIYFRLLPMQLASNNYDYRICSVFLIKVVSNQKDKPKSSFMPPRLIKKKKLFPKMEKAEKHNVDNGNIL